MENPMEAIKDILSKADLTQAKKDMLLMMFEKAGTEYQSVFAEEYKDHPEEVPQFFADMQEVMDLRDDPEALGGLLARKAAEIEAANNSGDVAKEV